MNDVAGKLVSRVVRYQLAFSAGGSVLLAWLVPHLLLADPAVVQALAEHLFVAMWVAGITGSLWTVLRLRRHRFLLRSLALGSPSIEPYEMAALGEEPPRVTRGWLIPHGIALTALPYVWRPQVVDLTTALSAGILTAVVAAAASLPLHVLWRSTFLAAMELAPTEVMREVAEMAQARHVADRRIVRRLVTAVATPVAFIAVGSTLIGNAHLRRADEYSREETARAIARASFELGPGLVESAGLDEAVTRARSLGFAASLSSTQGEYTIKHAETGETKLTTPLDQGSAVMRFSGSTVPTFGAEMLTLAVLAVALAALLGLLLGRAYCRDLETATRSLSVLGTDAVMRGDRLVGRPARFRVVAELEEAIDQLARRFRIFARAQQRAVESREASVRMRGLFFASVSHDLKSPLNAVLGFSELVRLEPLTPAQAESLSVIERRGRELLALIETILDAARVEAGQLSLVTDSVRVADLVHRAVHKARELGGEHPGHVVTDVELSSQRVLVDVLRASRALATVIAYALREAGDRPVRVSAALDETRQVRITVTVPNQALRVKKLDRLLSPSAAPGDREHRGLALGLSLARSVFDLHGGAVFATRGADGEPLFEVRLPAERSRELSR